MEMNKDEGYICAKNIFRIAIYCLMFYFLLFFIWGVCCSFIGIFNHTFRSKECFTHFKYVVTCFKVYLFLVPIFEFNLYVSYKYKLGKVRIFTALINSNNAIYNFIYNESQECFKINQNNLFFSHSSFAFGSGSVEKYKYVGYNQYCYEIYLNESDSAEEYCAPKNESDIELHKITRRKFIQSINSQKLLPFELTPEYLYFGLYYMMIDKDNAKYKIKNDYSKTLDEKQNLLNELDSKIKIPKFS